MALTNNEMRQIDFNLCSYLRKNRYISSNFLKKHKETFNTTFHLASAT